MVGAQALTIGVFDSGVGGLTVARALLAARPDARLIYLGDTAHVPYGPRPLAQIRDFALQIIAFLLAEGADAVVMGCNMSAASGARDVAAARWAQPIFEVITPGSAAAVAASRTGAIGVIATQGTVTSGAYPRALAGAGAAAVTTQACPAFVPLVERGIADGPEVERAVADYLAPLQAAGIDTLIFGCTHYPFLRGAIGRVLGDGVTLVDPAEHVAQALVAHFGPPAGPAAPLAAHRFFVSGDPASLQREGERFLGIPLLTVTQVDVPVDRPAECGAATVEVAGNGTG